MTQDRATLPVAVSRGTHDLVRRIAYEQRTTMRKVIEEAVWNTYGGMKTPAGLVGQVNRKDVYEYADGSLAVEEDHAYLRKLTEAELKEWEGK